DHRQHPEDTDGGGERDNEQEGTAHTPPLWSVARCPRQDRKVSNRLRSCAPNAGWESSCSLPQAAPGAYYRPGGLDRCTPEAVRLPVGPNVGHDVLRQLDQVERLAELARGIDCHLGAQP